MVQKGCSPVVEMHRIDVDLVATEVQQVGARTAFCTACLRLVYLVAYTLLLDWRTVGVHGSLPIKSANLRWARKHAWNAANY